MTSDNFLMWSQYRAKLTLILHSSSILHITYMLTLQSSKSRIVCLLFFVWMGCLMTRFLLLDCYTLKKMFDVKKCKRTLPWKATLLDIDQGRL